MSVTVVTRWTTPDVEASTQVAKRAKAVWQKAGALDVRLNQMFTGPFAGQWLFVVVFSDMPAYAKAVAGMASDADMKKLIADNAKIGAVMQERELLMGTDL